MRVLFLLLPLALKMVVGLDMCNGPFDPPELLAVTMTPVYHNTTNLVTEVEVSVEVMSSNPVEVLWVAYGMGCIDAKYASEDCENARSSADVTGERHAFRLHVKLPKGIQNVADISRGITLRLNTVYDCNVVSFGMLLERALELARDHIKLPKVTQMPRQRYIVNDTSFHVLTIGITLGPNGEPPWVRPDCSPKYERKNGRFLRMPFVTTYGFESSLTKLESSGVTETTCVADFGQDIDSVYVEIRHDVNSIDPTSQGAYIYADTIRIKMLTEFRRPGVTKPAIMLIVDNTNPIESDNGDQVLPTKTNQTDMFCSADAANKPNVEMSRLADDGTYEPLTRRHLPLSKNYYNNLGSARFSVSSPSLLGEEEYVCTATSGNEVTSQKIKLIRVEPVDRASRG